MAGINKTRVDNAILRALELTFVRELIIRTPKKTGFTANSWSSRALGNFEYEIFNPQGDIILFLEEGTRPHAIKPKTKKMLRFRIDKPPKLRNKKEEEIFRKKGVIFFFNKLGEAVLGFSKEGSRYYCYAKKVKHPGFEGRHFLKQVLEDKGLYQKFEDLVWKELKKELAKI